MVCFLNKVDTVDDEELLELVELELRELLSFYECAQLHSIYTTGGLGRILHADLRGIMSLPAKGRKADEAASAGVPRKRFPSGVEPFHIHCKALQAKMLAWCGWLVSESKLWGGAKGHPVRPALHDESGSSEAALSDE